MLHGGSYICLGYSFGGGKLVYLSDVSEVQPHILAKLGKFAIENLVLDALAARGTHPSHFCLPDSLELVRKLRPQQTLLVGMSCDMGLHEDVNAELEKMKSTEGLDVRLARDGMKVRLNFL